MYVFIYLLAVINVLLPNCLQRICYSYGYLTVVGPSATHAKRIWFWGDYWTDMYGSWLGSSVKPSIALYA